MTDCARCGACCRVRLVEAYWHDAAREPRLLEPATNPSGLTLDDLDEGERCVVMGFPCAFLGPDNVCAIYPTRPNGCVGFEPGSVDCDEARADAGLPSLTAPDAAEAAPCL